MRRSAIRHSAVIVILIAALASCGDVVIGPVDHSCPTKPWRGSDGSGSGCGVGRG